jgi:CheY-like chemotaxis protein
MSAQAKPLKILLVEDNPIAAMVNSKLLEELGYKPDTAVNGTEAINMADNHYDLIFMDIGLPDINGIAASAEIRRREQEGQKHARIVALTAYKSEEVRDNCLKSGMNDVATKPISSEQLQKIIMEAAA